MNGFQLGRDLLMTKYTVTENLVISNSDRAACSSNNKPLSLNKRVASS